MNFFPNRFLWYVYVYFPFVVSYDLYYLYIYSVIFCFYSVLSVYQFLFFILLLLEILRFPILSVVVLLSLLQIINLLHSRRKYFIFYVFTCFFTYLCESHLLKLYREYIDLCNSPFIKSFLQFWICYISYHIVRDEGLLPSILIKVYL